MESLGFSHDVMALTRLSSMSDIRQGRRGRILNREIQKSHPIFFFWSEFVCRNRRTTFPNTRLSEVIASSRAVFMVKTVSLPKTKGSKCLVDDTEHWATRASVRGTLAERTSGAEEERHRPPCKDWSMADQLWKTVQGWAQQP